MNKEEIKKLLLSFTAPTVLNIQYLHRKILNVPVVIYDDRGISLVTIYAHRKTHKRIIAFTGCWKPPNVAVQLKHAPWSDLK